jgi:protein dithiol oxidoreductase (disulfide-forming)
MMLAAMMFMAFAGAQASREVTTIDPPQPTPNDGTIEVLEFFSYGCIACANLEPALDEWSKKLPADVKFRRVPSGFNFMGIDDIAVFHTLEAMGQLDRLHKKLFEAAHNEKVMLGSRPTYLKWLEKQGIDAAKYESIEKSFSVQSKIMRGRSLAGLYKVTSTPTIVVNGRFGAHQFGEAKAFLSGTIERLINEARAANAPQAAPPKAAPTKTAPPKTAAQKTAPVKTATPATSK